MASTGGGPAAPTPLSRALDTVKRLRAELDEIRKPRPLAVVGIGLRLPGALADLGSFWDALASGRDLVRPLPENRREPFGAEWDEVPIRAGYLPEILDFDADFFGINPREAAELDPQQRLSLEVAWEALEDAALPPGRPESPKTGLFIGIANQDYGDWRPAEPGAGWVIGNARCFAPGRVAHTLGLTGPVLAVDTACSSSLVAVHLARQALDRGECEIALAGGVNVIASPDSTRLLSRFGLLAPDGLCKSFDARANGFTRAEGCGMVVLKPLDRALRDGDRIHAVLHGSAVNHDGRSASMAAPNVRAQTDLVRTALADAGLTADDIGVLEAHGTGTAAGDPIEMEAVAAALGRPDDRPPLWVGTVKANMGHLESAAGIAGFIKAVLCLQHRAVPPLAHFQTLNPRIDLAGTGIRIPTSLEPWTGDQARYAAVSSFGMSGTNAHAVLGPPPVASAPESAPKPAAVTGFELSARDPEALRALADAYHDRLAGLAAAEYPAFAYTATEGRARHRLRARVLAEDPATASKALRALAEGLPSDAVTIVANGSVPNGDDLGEAVLVAPLPRAVVDLPHYPWQRRRYAVEPAHLGLPAM